MAMDAFTTQYIATLLWSSTGDDDQPLDRSYTSDDLAPETLERILADCEAFQRAHGDAIDAAHNVRTVTDSDNAGALMDASEDLRSQAGHDFWLTRTGHGAGFWDGDWPEPLATTLTNACKEFGNLDPYVGDDGRIYLA